MNSLAVANSSSLKTQLQSVVDLRTNVIGLSEHRLTASYQRQFDELLAEKGYSAAWGAPCKRKRFGGKVKPGGVAVLVRHPLTARAIVPDARRQPDAHQAWEAGRLMHAAIPMGKQTLHIIVVYGHPNSSTCLEQRGKNEPMLRAALQLMAELGKAPVFFVGDLNTTIEASGELTSAIRLGHVTDLARLQDGGGKPICIPKVTSEGTRIDHLLANSTAAAFGEVSVHAWG